MTDDFFKRAWLQVSPMAKLRHAITTSQAKSYWEQAQAHQDSYHFLPAPQFNAARQSDTIFVFGAGGSLNDITPAEWARIGAYDTLGWRLFAYQTQVKARFFMIREIVVTKYLWHYRESRYIEGCQRLMDQIAGNPQFDETIFLLQGGPVATMGNFLIAKQLLPHDHDYIRFYNDRRDPDAPPGDSLDKISHVYGSLSDAVNLAYVGGWRHIVLVGVDLYDSQYFMVPEGQKNPNWVNGVSDPKAQHTTTKSGIVGLMARWTAWFNERDVKLSVYNPRSLLTEVMPVFSWDDMP